MNEPLSSKPWVTIYDKWGDPTGEIAGSPEGLRRLRELIDEALVNGSVEIAPDVGFDFRSIKVSEKLENTPSIETTKQKFSNFGCLAALAILGLLVFMGGIKAFEIISR